MRNPFAKPRTLAQWLLGSICWTAFCLGGWLGGSYVLTSEPARAELNIYYFPLGFLVANPLLARYALLNGWAFISRRKTASSLWIKVVASSWFSILALFQLLCLACFLFVLSWFL